MATSFHGHGLAIGSITSTPKSELGSLQADNQDLRAQLDYAQDLLAAWHPSPCSICQLHGHTSTSSSGGKTAPSSSRSQGSNYVDAAVEQILRRQQVLIAQLQRQVVVLQVCRRFIDMRPNEEQGSTLWPPLMAEFHPERLHSEQLLAALVSRQRCASSRPHEERESCACACGAPVAALGRIRLRSEAAVRGTRLQLLPHL